MSRRPKKPRKKLAWHLTAQQAATLAQHMERKGVPVQYAADQLGISRGFLHDLLAGRAKMRRAYGLALYHVIGNYASSK